MFSVFFPWIIHFIWNSDRSKWVGGRKQLLQGMRLLRCAIDYQRFFCLVLDKTSSTQYWHDHTPVMPVLVTRSISIATKRIILAKGKSPAVCLFSSTRLSSAKQHNVDSVHLQATGTPHPLASEGNSLKTSVPKPTLPGLDETGKPIVEVMKRLVW